MKQSKQCSSSWKIQFFCQDAKINLRQLTRNALNEEIFSADGATLKLDNQKNGWKGVCVYQEKKMEMKSSARRGHLGGGSYQSKIK